MPELAPEQCIVCGKKPAKDEAARKAEGWVYLAGATPLGALACGAECATVAVERLKFSRGQVKSNGTAELRRNYEELVNALRALEEENKRLRALLEKYQGKKLVEVRVEKISERQMTGAGAGPAGAKSTIIAGQLVPASSGASAGRESDAPAPGQFVDYLPPGGKKGTVPRLALVLEVKPGGVLRLKVKHAAQPDEVLDDVGPTRWRARAFP